MKIEKNGLKLQTKILEKIKGCNKDFQYYIVSCYLLKE